MLKHNLMNVFTVRSCGAIDDLYAHIATVHAHSRFDHYLSVIFFDWYYTLQDPASSQNLLYIKRISEQSGKAHSGSKDSCSSTHDFASTASGLRWCRCRECST